MRQQVVVVDVAHIPPADGHGARGYVVEAPHQLDESRLPRTGGPDEGQPLARPHGERDVVQDLGGVVAVCEGHAVEANRRVLGKGLASPEGGNVEELLDALGARRGLGEFVGEVLQQPDLSQVERPREGEEKIGRPVDGAVGQHQGAQGDHEEEARLDDDDVGREPGAGPARHLAPHFVLLVHGGAEPPERAGAHVERLDHAHAADVLHHDRVHVLQGLHGSGHDGSGDLEQADEHRERGDRGDERDQRQRRVRGQEEDECGGGPRDVHEGLRQVVREQEFELLDVVGEDGLDPAGAAVVQFAQRRLRQAVEDAAAHVEQGAVRAFVREGVRHAEQDVAQQRARH